VKSLTRHLTMHVPARRDQRVLIKIIGD